MQNSLLGVIETTRALDQISHAENYTHTILRNGTWIYLAMIISAAVAEIVRIIFTVGVVIAAILEIIGALGLTKALFFTLVFQVV